MNTKDMIEIMVAYTQGEKIEFRVRSDGPDDWSPACPNWNWSDNEYRIAKPESRKVKLVAFIDDQGYVRFVKEELFVERKPPYTRVPVLDIEVEHP